MIVEIKGFLTKKRFRNYAYSAGSSRYDRYHIVLPVKDRELLNMLPQRFKCVVEIPKVLDIETKCFKSTRSVYAYIPSKYVPLMKYVLSKITKIRIRIRPVEA